MLFSTQFIQILDNLNLENSNIFKILINLILDNKKIIDLDSKIWVQKILLEKKFNKKKF